MSTQAMEPKKNQEKPLHMATKISQQPPCFDSASPKFMQGASHEKNVINPPIRGEGAGDLPFGVDFDEPWVFGASIQNLHDGCHAVRVRVSSSRSPEYDPPSTQYRQRPVVHVCQQDQLPQSSPALPNLNRDEVAQCIHNIRSMNL
jgi:hypothetical protein